MYNLVRMKRDYKAVLSGTQLINSNYLDREYAAILGKLDLIDSLLNADSNLIDIEEIKDES